MLPSFPLGCPPSGIWQGSLEASHLQGEGGSLLLSRPSHLFSLAGWCRALLQYWAPGLQALRLPHSWDMAGWRGSSVLSRQPCLCALVGMPAPILYTLPLGPCRLAWCPTPIEAAPPWDLLERTLVSRPPQLLD